MAGANEEFIAEYARVIGNAYIAVQNGIGDENTPGTAIFNLNQLVYLAKRKLPAFGIVQTGTSPGFSVSVDTIDGSFLNITGGTVAYKDNTIKVPPQRLSIKRNFEGTYSTSYVYGMKIGFPYEEVQKTSGQIYTSVLTQTFSVNDTVMYIDNPKRIIDLGFPITAYIGTNTYVVFSNYNSSNGLVIDPGINKSSWPSSFEVGTMINFVYEPKIKAIYGLPVSTASNNPVDFDYYPVMPSTWLPIADVLVLNPSSPEVATYGTGTYSIYRTAIDYPSQNYSSPIFSDADGIVINKAASAAINQLANEKARASVSDAIVALENYTNAIQKYTNKSFVDYWSSLPLERSTYFNRGVIYEGLERFEFSDNFSRAYHNVTGNDIVKTFAIFRGDLYTNPSLLTGTGPTIYLNSYSNFKGLDSTISNGTYRYGVSAVTALGETTPVYGTVITSSNANTYVNTIQYASKAGALFYHIYRLSSFSGELTEYRLTKPYEVTGSGQFSIPSVVGNSNYALTTNGIAFQINPSGGTQFGGIKIRLKISTTDITNDEDYISVKLYSNSASLPSSEITDVEFDNILFSELLRDNQGNATTSYQDFIIKANKPVASDPYFTFTPGNSYWIVLTLNQNPSSGTISLSVRNTGSGVFASYNGSSWTTVNSNTAYHEILGFIDNGIAGTSIARRGLYFTGKESLIPKQLRINVPVIDSYPSTITTSGGFNTSNDPEQTQNDMYVTVIAQNGNNESVTLDTILIPQNTASGSYFLLGTENDLFTKVVDVQVVPGTNLRTALGGSIIWSKYDTFIVESVP